MSLAIPLAGYVISPALKRRDKPWLHLMPDLQILKPAVERIDTAVVISFRAKVDY